MENSLVDGLVKTCNTGSLNIVVKVSKRCNLRPPCEYCYDYEAQSDSPEFDMNRQTLESLIKKSVSDPSFSKVKFVWHGGEPLIMGREFYEQALEFQRRYNPGNTRIINHIQTNAVALDDSWISFLKGNGFSMESSFDAFDNKLTRGQTDKVLSNILNSQKQDYAPGCIMFICTRRNVNRLREAYDYFENLELDFNPSPIISLGKACQANHLAITPEEYGNALSDLMDYYALEHKEHKISIRFLDAILSAVITGHQNLCSHGFCVYEFISTDHKGDIYPCAKANDPEWCFGNVNTINSFSDVFNSERYQIYAKECRQRIEKCATEDDGKPCNVLEYCRGGCASNAMAAGGYSKRDFYCQAYKIVFNHAMDLVLKLREQRKST